MIYIGEVDIQMLAVLSDLADNTSWMPTIEYDTDASIGDYYRSKPT